MRFARYQNFPFVRTKLKDAAFLRKQRREVESMPLFADDVRAAQKLEPGLEEVMARRAAAWIVYERESRSKHAARWLDARRKLRQISEPLQSEIRAYWQICNYPADPTYLSSLIHTRLTQQTHPKEAA